MNKYILLCLFLFFEISCICGKEIYQESISIPIERKSDVVIVGGTTAAVSAAATLSKNGIDVLLVTNKPYLGEDITSTLTLESQILSELNSSNLFSSYNINYSPSPLYVKSLFSKVLEDNNVEVIYSSYPTDVCLDKDNNICGLVIGNRAGRQYLKTKLVIDATKNSIISRISGIKILNDTSFISEMYRNVITKYNGDTIFNRIKLPFTCERYSYKYMQELEQKSRDITYSDSLLFGADNIQYLPSEYVECRKSSKEFSSFELSHFRVKNIPNLLLFSEYADIPKKMMYYLNNNYHELINLVEKLSNDLVDEVRYADFKELKDVENIPGKPLKGYKIKEIKLGLRSSSLKNAKKEYVDVPAVNIPIIADYDVVVVGGGTSGAPAAISAARAGSSVLVVEYLSGLGGTATLGMIGKPHYGIKNGFASTVPFPDNRNYSIEYKMEWYRKELKKCGADIWFESMGCGVVMDENKVKGVVILTPAGRKIVMADMIIDATGNADLAIAAGASYMYGDIENGKIALQGSGMPTRNLIGTYYNTDYLLVDDVDIIDVSSTIDGVTQVKYREGSYDVSPIIQNRERRRIIGEEKISYIEQIAGKGYKDVIVYSHSNYDSHCYPTSLYFSLLPHDSQSMKANNPAPGGNCSTPFRALIPKGLDNILVVGISISMDRDVTALVRMQYDLSNQGYAAGYAASMAIKRNIPIREISIKELQNHLVEIGSLSDSIITNQIEFPLKDSLIYNAINDYGCSKNPKQAGKPLAIILSHKEIALPILKKKVNSTTGYEQLMYAKLLGVLGCDEGVDVLINELNRIGDWQPKILQGSMACFAHLPTLQDELITAITYSGSEKAYDILIDKLSHLSDDVTLSHHFSIMHGLEYLKNKSACKYLAELLSKNGMSGYYILNIQDLKQTLKNDGKRQLWRTKALREITIARVLYICGDYNDVGKNILLKYSKDLRGLFVRHANYILNNY